MNTSILCLYILLTKIQFDFFTNQHDKNYSNICLVDSTFCGIRM